jgi:hypothetical protein
MKPKARRSRKPDCQERTRVPSFLERSVTHAIDKHDREVVAVMDSLCNQQRLRREIENSAREILDARLSGFGWEEGDRKDVQADLLHLRYMRQRAEQVHGFLLKGIITCALTGFMGALWLGLKTAIGR